MSFQYSLFYLGICDCIMHMYVTRDVFATAWARYTYTICDITCVWNYCHPCNETKWFYSNVLLTCVYLVIHYINKLNRWFVIGKWQLFNSRHPGVITISSSRGTMVELSLFPAAGGQWWSYHYFQQGGDNGGVITIYSSRGTMVELLLFKAAGDNGGVTTS